MTIRLIEWTLIWSILGLAAMVLLSEPAFVIRP